MPPQHIPFNENKQTNKQTNRRKQCLEEITENAEASQHLEKNVGEEEKKCHNNTMLEEVRGFKKPL